MDQGSLQIKHYTTQIVTAYNMTFVRGHAELDFKPLLFIID